MGQDPAAAGADRALAALALAAAALIPASTLVFFWQSRWPAPARDLWFFMPVVEDLWAGRPLLGELLAPYAGHRIFFPKLLYLAEFRWFGGENQLLNGSSLVLQATSALMLVRAARREGAGLAAPAPALLAALPLVALFSATQIENFVRGWNSAWPLTLASVVASLLALARASESLARPRAAAGWLAASTLAAGLGAWSTLNGLLTFPVLVLLAFALRFPVRWLVGLAAAAAACVAAFFVDYRLPSASSPGAAALQPLALAAWLVRFFGMPLSSEHVVLGGALGAAALLATAALWLRALVARPPMRPLEAVYLGLLLSGLATGVVTGLGRLGRAYETWDDTRYQTFGMAFWLALAALGVLHAATPRGASRRWRRGVAAAVLLWIAAVVAPAHLRQAREVRDLAVRIRAAQDAVVAGIGDREAYAATLAVIARNPPGPDQVARHAPFLRAHRLGMFASERAALMGRRIGADLAVAEASGCSGGLLGVHRFAGGGAALLGSLAGGSLARPRAIAVSDAGGRIVGLGATTRFAALDLEPLRAPPGASEWIAFASPVPPRARLRAWTLVGDRSLCPLGGAFALDGGEP